MELSDIIPAVPPPHRNEEQADVMALTMSENKHVKVFPKLTMVCPDGIQESNLNSLWIVSLFQGLVAFGMLIVQCTSASYVTYDSAEFRLSFWISIVFSALVSLFLFLIAIFRTTDTACLMLTFMFQSCSTFASFSFILMRLVNAFIAGVEVSESERFSMELFLVLIVPSAIAAAYSIKLMR